MCEQYKKVSCASSSSSSSSSSSYSLFLLLGELNASISLVIGNKADAYILERARTHQLPAHHVPGQGRTREQFDSEVFICMCVCAR